MGKNYFIYPDASLNSLFSVSNSCRVANAVFVTAASTVIATVNTKRRES